MKQITILRAGNWSITAGSLIDKLKLLDHGKDWQVEIVECTPEMLRNNDQNAYLHVIIGALAQHYREANKESYAPKAWKLWLKEEHFGYKDIATPDGVRQELPSTAKLSKKRFTEFVEFIRTFANDNLECYLMTPDEWRQSKYYD